MLEYIGFWALLSKYYKILIIGLLVARILIRGTVTNKLEHQGFIAYIPVLDIFLFGKSVLNALVGLIMSVLALFLIFYIPIFALLEINIFDKISEYLFLHMNGTVAFILFLAYILFDTILMIVGISKTSDNIVYTANNDNLDWIRKEQQQALANQPTNAPLNGVPMENAGIKTAIEQNSDNMHDSPLNTSEPNDNTF